MTQSPRPWRNPQETHRSWRQLRHAFQQALVGISITALIPALAILTTSTSATARIVPAANTATSQSLSQPGVAAHKRSHKPVVRASRMHAVQQNIAPRPNFLTTCEGASASSCLNDEITAIDAARHSEGLRGLPIDRAGFLSLTAEQQLFVVVNLERISRRFPPIAALTSQLNAVAAVGNAHAVDPALQGWLLFDNKAVTGWASNWAGGLSILGADYFWMYDDGVGYNVDCTTVNTSGCWGHRDNVLFAGPTASSCNGLGGHPELLMGASVEPTAFEGSTGIAELIVNSCGGLPRDTTFTWARARAIAFGAGTA